MARPGVYVSEAPLERVLRTTVATEAYGAFIGTALRGPITPTRCDSWSDFVSIFGGFARTKTLPRALYQFFNNAKSSAYVCRVLPSDAVAATKNYQEAAQTRIAFTAATKGVWGNSIYYSIEDINTLASTFSITIYDTVRGVRVAVERFKDLSMVQTSPRYVVNIVNSTTIGSNFVTVVDSKKDNAPLVAPGQPTPVLLAGGSDGVAALVAGDYTAAFDQFDVFDAMFVVNVPGEMTNASGVVAKAAARGDSVVILDTPENQNPDMSGLTLPTSSYAAVYYPWIYIADPSPDAPRGSILKVPPGAAATGVILSMDSSRGVYRAPAGTAARINGAVEVERLMTNTQLDTLADSHVNVIRPLSGMGMTIMGARTGSQDAAQYLSVRRTLNWVKKKSSYVCRFALFEPNTPALWDQLRVANGSFLSELWQNGGLAGSRPEQAYYVIVDETNNTPQTIANGEVHVEIGVAPVYPAEFIIIRVGQFESGASVVVTEGGLF